MSVTETLQGLGGWSLTLVDAPAELIDALQYFGHVAIHTGRVDYRTQGDSALTSSRYTGVLRKKELNDDTMVIGGPGMAMWLGDEDQKGEVYETPVVITAQTFENALRLLLPDSVTEGTFFNIGQNFTGTIQNMSPRQAIDYVCSTLGAEWVVRGDARLDAGLESDLFVTVPKTVVARNESGVDMLLRGYLGNAKTAQDVEDFTTRVALLGTTAEGVSVITATADINPGLNPYRDRWGNPIKMTRFVSETATDPTNAPARAQLQLNRFSDTRDSLTLDSDEYDIKGDLSVGDYMWVHDPEIALVDGNNQIIFRGKRLNPMKLRLTELTWPLTNKFSVGFRDWSGKWWNLTDWIEVESGSSTLVVGGYNRSLTSGGADGGAGGTVPVPDPSIPDVPTWVTPFIQSVYQSITTGDTKAQVQLHWTRPNNTDGSSIVDGDHYEIRWRTSSTPIFPATYNQLAGLQWNALGTWDQPIVYPVGDWTYLFVAWSQLTVLLQELSPSMPYEAQIRAVDGAVPSNYGAWSTLTVFQTNGDTIAPSTPAPPLVAASRIAAQVTHTLGVAAGGTYNLDSDLHHLEIHGQYEPNFTPSDATLLGKIIANVGMINAQVPAVGTVPIESTNPTYFKVIAVDNSGNKSNPSAATQQTALLIDNAHISDLTVSKVTAGTIQADWLVGARIATAFTGPRVEMAPDGITTVNSNGDVSLRVDSATGDVQTIGSLKSGVLGTRVEINPVVGVRLPEIRLYPATGSNYAVINAFSFGTPYAGAGMNSGSSDGVTQGTVFAAYNSVSIGMGTVGGPSPFRGGYFTGDLNQGKWGFATPVTGVDSYMAFNGRDFFSKGRFPISTSLDPLQLMWADAIDVANGFTFVSFAFGATLLQNPGILCGWDSFGSNDTRDASHLAAFSSTGCDVGNQWSSSAPGGRFVIWGFQY